MKIWIASLALWAAAGCDSGFSVEIDVERACLGNPPSAIDITVTAEPSGAIVTQTVRNPDVSFPSHRVVIVPPDGVTSLLVVAVARDGLGGVIGTGSITVAVSGHHLAQATLTISGPGCGDGGSDGCAGEGGCPCATDLECGGATPRCDTTSSRCVACLPTSDNCPLGRVCTKTNGQYQCALGCKSDVDCTGADAGAIAPRCCNQVCVDTASDDNNCAMCGKACGAGNGCCGGMCHDVTSDPANCGMCGGACNLAHAVAGCAMSACDVLSCVPGFDDCDLAPANGCESENATDPGNCGDCGMPCSPSHATPHCTGGACDSPCDKGFLDCNGDLRGDGCEVNGNTNAANCGGCNVLCSNAHISVPTCANGVCNGNCDFGYSDCNGSKRVDGCEINSAIDPAHCGNCNTICASGVCAGGSCVRRIFVSSALYSGGELGGLVGADALCQDLANAAMLGGTWRAWLSDANTNAAARVSHPAAGYQLVGGTRVAMSWMLFTNAALLHPINTDEHGLAAPVGTANCTMGAPFAWTDTSSNGVRSFAPDCQNWTSSLVTDNASGGSAQAIDATWSNTGCQTTCDLTASLYCLEQ